MGVKAVEDPVAESEKNLCDLCVSAVKQFQVIELFFTAEAQRTRRDGRGEFNDLPKGFGGLIFRLGLRLSLRRREGGSDPRPLFLPSLDLRSLERVDNLDLCPLR